MAIRYSFVLIPDPSFLRLLHTSRQILCNQFGCWTSEMFMIHVPLINFFKLDFDHIGDRKQIIENMIESYRSTKLTLIPSQITQTIEDSTDLHIECLTLGESESLVNIKSNLIKIFELRGFDGDILKIPLLENFHSSPTVWEEALTMAKDLFYNFGLDTPFDVRSLDLVKYESRSSSEKWEREKWSRDISWDILESFKLR